MLPLGHISTLTRMCLRSCGSKSKLECIAPSVRLSPPCTASTHSHMHPPFFFLLLSSPRSESEVDRIARVAFEAAMKRGKRLCSVETSNVLEVSQLWKEVVVRVAADYPDVELSHM